MTTCLCGCGATIPNTRGAKYASAKCRANASKARRAPIPATVRAVRVLKGGMVQVIVHVPPLWAAGASVRLRGTNIELGVGNGAT